MNVTFNILTVKNCEKCENILKEQLHFIDRKHNFGFYFQIEFPQPLKVPDPPAGGPHPSF